MECPLKAQCTTSSKGRSVSIHPDEALLIELRERQQTTPERSKLRERHEGDSWKLNHRHVDPLISEPEAKEQ